MGKVFALLLLLFVGTSCGHLVGGAVNKDNPESYKGVRYYLPRTEFLLEETVSGSKKILTVKARQVPDLRYPYHVYLSQGLFSTDIFDIVLLENGLITSVSGDSSEQTIESTQALAEMAVDILGPAAGIPIAAQSDSSNKYFANNDPSFHLATVRPAQAGGATLPCAQNVNNLTLVFSITNLSLLDRELDTFITEGTNRHTEFNDERKKFLKLLDSKIATAQERKTFIKQRVKNSKLITKFGSCLKIIARETATINSAFASKFEGADENKATQYFAAKLLLEEKRNSLSMLTSTLKLDLENTFFVLTVDDLANELTSLGKNGAADEVDKFFKLRRLDLAGLKRSLTDWHDTQKLEKLDAVTRLSHEVSAITGEQCGNNVSRLLKLNDHKLQKQLEKMKTNFGNLEKVFRLIEEQINCILKVAEINPNSLRNNAKERIAVGGTLSNLLMAIEFLQEPAKGERNAIRRTKPLISSGMVRLDKSYKYEMSLNKAFRIRDRLEDFSWRQVILKHNIGVMKKKKAQIITAKSRISRVKSLMQQRNLIRDFLETSVPTNKSKIRTELQEELVGVYKELESLLAIPKVQSDLPKRRLTPRVLHLTETSNVPSGIEGGKPGDVYILIRPRGYVEGLE